MNEPADKPRSVWPTLVAAAVALLLAYASAYLLLIEDINGRFPTICLPTSYRYSESRRVHDVLWIVFLPAHKTDMLLRPGFWID